MAPRLLSALVAAGLVCLAGSAATAQEITDDLVDEAIRKGVEYLVGMQKDDGTWPTHKLGDNANTVMCMLALAYAEYDPKSEVMQKGLEALLKADLTTERSQSYLTAFRCQALAKLLKQVDHEKKRLIRARLAQDAANIVKGQTEVGGWSYQLGGGSALGDFSNIQICMLGLGEAVKAGLELKREPFFKAMMLYMDRQQEDGGWNYGRKVHDAWPWTDNQALGTYGSMTAAGVASLYICRDYLYPGLGCPCRGGRSNYKANKVDLAINAGLRWLGDYYKPNKNPRGTHHTMYWHYSCERVGLASGIKYFGGHDWYKEGTRYVLDRQDGNGSWGHVIRDGHWNSSPGCAWALLFLIKGRAPILMNKLQFDGAWNYHPHDLKNLARYVGDRKEQTFAWQVITIEAPVDEWHDAPILYITPESIIELTDEQKKKLREFTDDGGTILFEASCGSLEVRRWWKMTAREIWPEFEFRPVDDEHPVWTADLNVRRPLRRLQEMSDGVRSFIFYAPTDISCAWNTAAVTRRGAEFKFGLNLYAYATDRAKIRSRLARATFKKTRQEEFEKIKVEAPRPIHLVRMKHGGDWNVTSRYRVLEKLAARLREGLGIETTVHEPAAPGEEGFPKDAVVYATGRVDVSLLPDGREALKQRLADGAFLLVDAALGDARFRDDFETFAGEMGWTLERLPEDHPILRGSFPGATGHDLTGPVQFTHTAVSQATGPLRLDLRGIYSDGNLVGVCSPRDAMYGQAALRAFGSIGYREASAQQVVENVLLYATQTGPAPREGKPAAGGEQPAPAAAAPAEGEESH